MKHKILVMKYLKPQHKNILTLWVDQLKASSNKLSIIFESLKTFTYI
ncbi:hypothetical protein L1276_004487 [Flavobacterium sp. HSC-32F16]|nr:hypothetical protein [Flavobacterium sp. HSC-32F16]